MLQFGQQYDIAQGIFVTYDSQLDYRLLHSNHKFNTKENSKSYFPYQKWEGKTKETFVLACVYIMFSKTPSSFRGMLAELRELELKEITMFKHIILNYQEFIGADVKFFREKYGSNITQQIVLKEFMDGNIKFYTAWFFRKYDNDQADLGRTFGHVLRKLKFMMLFLTFKGESIIRINSLLTQIEL